MMQRQQQAPPGQPTAKHDLCQMTILELMSPDRPGGPLSEGDPCLGCHVLDGRNAPVCVHPSAPAGDKINPVPFFLNIFIAFHLFIP